MIKNILFIAAALLLFGCGQTRDYVIETEDCRTGKLDTTIVTSYCKPTIHTYREAVPIVTVCGGSDIINVCKVRILSSEQHQINKVNYGK